MTTVRPAMRVAAVQFRPPKADVPGALRALAPLVEAAAPSTDLVVLPEMCTTGYVFDSADEVRPHCEPPDGRLFTLLSDAARRHRTWVVAGFAEDAGDRLFNSALVVDRDGTLAGRYRKTLLYDNDETWATPGDGAYPVFDTGAGTFGVGICMDLNDERFTAWLRDAAPDVLAFPTNWLDQQHRVWGYWAWRLLGWPGTLVAANTWGTDRGVPFRGESAILRERALLAAAGPADDAVLHAEAPLHSRKGP